MGRLYLLMGKSASGKDAVYRNLLQDETLSLKKVVSYTTRPMREGETNGKQYHFVTEDDYLHWKEEQKIIEERHYDTRLGLWRYFTADDGQIDLEKGSFLMIGTIEACVSVRAYFGKERVIPLLIDTDDGIRLERALKRERRQQSPRYDEMCRRYLADDKDFSKEALESAGITTVFTNNDTLESCLKAVSAFIRQGEETDETI